MEINKEEYLYHIHDVDHENAMKRVLDLIEITLNRHILSHTDFLEPNLVKLAKSILNRFDDIEYVIDGGFENAERSVITIFNDYHYFDRQLDSPLRAFKITGNIGELEHRDVLGSVLGLGITRDKVGDIGFFEDSIKIVLHKDISDFILFNLRKIKREYIEIKEIPLSELGEIIEEGSIREVTASSMRLDCVISEAFNLSRSDAKKLIQSELVKVNFDTEDKFHKELEEKDLISVRGKGRVRIKKIGGLTKKERIKLTLFYPE